MKRNKTLGLLLSILLLHAGGYAQPKVGAMIYGAFGPDYKQGLVAKVMAVNGKEFTVRFPHSGSDYVFSPTPSEAVAQVVSTKGGKFAKGTLFAYNEFRISEQTYECITSKDEGSPVMVRFPDGKSFMGHIKSFTAGGGMKITFWHSWSTYTIDADSKVTAKTAGAYPIGTQLKVFCADEVYAYPGPLKPPHRVEPKLN
ncbi:MAG: hypothetical protein EOO04_26845 [Chitinophagaceae bacterium]|nr:MAG: hypothetical protein EOO04_26845 [Chitinophagaceae bacterium]